MIADEGHYSRISPPRRIGDQAKAADHPAVDHIVVGAARRILALAGKDLVEVAVIRLSRARPAVTLAARPCRDRPERTGRLALFRLPIQTVVRAGGTRQLLGVLEQSVAIAVERRIF